MTVYILRVLDADDVPRTLGYYDTMEQAEAALELRSSQSGSGDLYQIVEEENERNIVQENVCLHNSRTSEG